MTPETRPAWWAYDARGRERAVRVSSHVEAGFLVLSTWNAGVCVGTVRLLPEEAAELMSGLAAGLAGLANDAHHPEPGQPSAAT